MTVIIFLEYTDGQLSLDELEEKITQYWDVYSNIGQTWSEAQTDFYAIVQNFEWQTLFKYANQFGTVLSGIWTQIIANFHFVWWFIMKGWGFFNFLFSLVLFLTALFYVIGTSEESTYKPINWILFVFPDGPLRDEAVNSIHTAVSQVFKTAFKLSLFHTLWTWLTYYLFGCRMVYLPTLLAAIIAMIPLFPTYCTCIPGVLELWFVGHKFASAGMFILHFAASWWIDPLIYSEIEQSHHYVTGLSVVGGLYFFGIQGVLLGPMLVCSLLILTKLVSAGIQAGTNNGAYAQAQQVQQ